MFSCGFCYSDRRIVLSYCEKRKVNYFLRTKGRIHYNTFNEQQKCHATKCTVEEKQMYHITFFCEKNKSIILHHILRKTFSCGLCYSDRRIVLSYCEKRKVNYYVCKKNNRARTFVHFSCGLCYDFVMMKLKQQWTNCQTKYRTIFQVKEVSYGFCWNASSHANKMFLMVTQSLTNYLIFTWAWLPYGMPYCQVFYLRPIFLLRIIGKPSLITIEKFGF